MHGSHLGRSVDCSDSLILSSATSRLSLIERSCDKHSTFFITAVAMDSPNLFVRHKRNVGLSKTHITIHVDIVLCIVYVSSEMTTNELKECL